MKGKAIFLRLLFPVIAGIIAGMSLPVSRYSVSTLAILCILLILLLLLFNAGYIRYRFYMKRWYPGWIVQLFLVCAFSAQTILHHPLYDDRHFSKNKVEALLGEIVSEPVRSGKTLRFEVLVKSGLKGSRFDLLSGKLPVTVYSDSTEKCSYSQGDHLLLPAAYSETAPPLNPFEFDYKNYLAGKGIFHQAFLDADRVKILNIPTQKTISWYAQELRRQMVGRFSRCMRDGEAAAIASTLILGYRASLSHEVLNAYSKTGVMHVLSVSGMHVALVMLLITKLLWFMDRRPWLRLIRAVLIILLVWFYALLTGFSAAVNRAALMISFLVAAKVAGRDNNTANTVAASAVLLLVYDPYYLVDTGFQLSYLAVFGLVYVYPPLYRFFASGNWLADKLIAYTALSVAAQLATFPLCLYYFHQFPLYFLLGNLFIVLPVSVVMYAGILFLLIPFEPFAILAARVTEEGILLINRGLFFLERWPYAGIHGARFGLWYYLIIYAAVILFFTAFLYKGKKLLLAALVVTVFLISVDTAYSYYLSRKSNILFYSIRKGVAVGFFKDGHAYIISDFDPSDSRFSYGVSPFIEAGNYKLMKTTRLSQPVESGPLYCDGNFIRFDNHRLFIWDTTFDTKVFTGSVAVDQVLLNGNPSVKLVDLCRYVKFRQLLIGSDNPDHRISSWENEAKMLKLDCYVLKNAPALEVRLK